MRITYYLLLPICLVFAVFLVSQGMIQNSSPTPRPSSLEPYTIQVPKTDDKGQPVTTNMTVMAGRPVGRNDVR